MLPLVVALLMLGLGGCETRAADQAAPEPGPPIEDPPLPPAPPERPATRPDTVLLEGMPEPIELRLVRSPDDFPLPFTTYVPEDFVVEPTTRDGVPALRFIAAFGGQRNDSAYIEIAPYPPDLNESQAAERARAAAGAVTEIEPVVQPAFDWTTGEWRFRGSGPDGPFVGRVLLGRHGMRHFHVLMRYPAEYGDGFGPRAAVIFHEWIWGDGTPLEDQSPSQ